MPQFMPKQHLDSPLLRMQSTGLSCYKNSVTSNNAYPDKYFIKAKLIEVKSD